MVIDGLTQYKLLGCVTMQQKIKLHTVLVYLLLLLYKYTESNLGSMRHNYERHVLKVCVNVLEQLKRINAIMA